MTARDAIRFRDLGPLEVGRAGSVQPISGVRLEAALALLLIHLGHAVSHDALAEAIWGAEGAHRSRTTLDSHIHRLRRLVEPDRDARGAPTVLVREPGGYRLSVLPEHVDSARFVSLAADADALLTGGDPGRALEVADAAGALWRGRPYGAAADLPWAGAAVARLEEIRGRLRETGIGAMVAVGAHDRALAELEVAVAEEPLREPLWAHRVTAYRAAGRRAQALSTYTRAREVLLDELGLEPGPLLRAAHAAVLADEPADVPVEIPAPRRAEPAPDLPAARGRFVGREDDLAALTEILTARALVTLTGAAGCGKTRLAVEVARRIAPTLPDGACFVDLTSATADRVPDTVASALELPPGADDPAGAVRGSLSAHRMLLVLDNCEHVLDAAADLVERLAGTASTVLCTSREPLEVDGEHVVGLEPLSGPAGAELLRDRLGSARGENDHHNHDEDADVIAEIVAAVDGLPLALELAAGRARSYTLSEIAAQVRADASSLGRVGRGRGTPHHRTVRDAVDTGYRDLPPALAALHRAASAIPGPFTAALAASITADPDVPDAVAGLVHRSLLTALGPARSGGASRFAQLATVRGHAAHQAAQAGEEPASARDAWVERLVRARPRFGSARNVGWYRALDDDRAAVRATLHHTLIDAPSAIGPALAARLGVHWTFGGMAVEGERWLRGTAAAAPGLGRRADRAAVRIDLGGLLLVQGRADEGAAHLRAGLRDAAGATGADADLLCAACTVAAGAVARAGDLALLADLAEATRQIAAGSAALAVCVRTVELVHETAAAPAPQLVPAYLALHRAARAEDNLYTAWLTAANAARILLYAGRATDSLPLAREALRASAEAGLRHNAYALEVYATALGRAGEHPAALRVFGAVEEQHRGASAVWPWDPNVAALITDMRSAVGADRADQLRAAGAKASLAQLADA